jgi:zinc protease
VQRVALAYLKRSNVTVGEFIPDAAPDRAPAPPPVDIAAMVKDYKGDPTAVAGETFDTSIANLDARTQRFTLPNGLKVALLPKKTRGEAVNFALTLRFADEESAFGKQADGQFTGAMLMRGTAKKSRQEIEDAQDQLRAHINVSGNEPARPRRGRPSARNFPTCCAWWRSAARAAFSLPELETLKRERATGLEASRSDPQQVAGAPRRKAIRIRSATRAIPTLDEELAWAKGVTPESMKKFHGQFYGANNAELALVGTSIRKPCARWSRNSSATGTARVPTRACPIRWCPKSPSCSSSKSPTRPTRS